MKIIDLKKYTGASAQKQIDDYCGGKVDRNKFLGFLITISSDYNIVTLAIILQVLHIMHQFHCLKMDWESTSEI